MSDVNQQSTAMCVRITEPSIAQINCSLAQVQERVLRKATHMFADKLFEESQVVVREVQPFGQVFGSLDITYEVELQLIPVEEHKKRVQMLHDELLGVRLKLHKAEQTIFHQATKIRHVRQALEDKL